MKTLALAALLASAATAAPAAVTIHFTGTTFESGSYTHSTETGDVAEEGVFQVEGTLVIDTDHVNDGAFLSGSFTSFGGAQPIILNSGAADDLFDYDAGFTYAGITFSREVGPGDGVHQDSTIYFYTSSPLLSRVYGGVELPDFTTADLSDLWFNVSSTDGTNEDYTGRYSLGQVTSVTVTEDVADVPEPASWAMMLGGFGLIGGALRRRRTSVTFA